MHCDTLLEILLLAGNADWSFLLLFFAAQVTFHFSHIPIQQLFFDTLIKKMNLIFPDNQLDNLISLWEHIFTDCLRRWVHFLRVKWKYGPPKTKNKERTKNKKDEKIK